MNKLTFKREMFREIEKLNDSIHNLQDNLSREKQISATLEERTDKLEEKLQELYDTLKTIEGKSKESIVKTICILKMQDIKNIKGVYIDE